MTQPRDYSNQDLRNRSFKGCDLAGADFRKADIRGCDFSNANLEGADFSRVTAGKSRKQLLMAFDGELVFLIITIVVSGYIVSLSLTNNNPDSGFVVFTIMYGIFGMVMGVVTLYTVGYKDESEISWEGLLGLLSAFFGSIYLRSAGQEFTKGNVTWGLTYSIYTFWLFGATYFAFGEKFKRIQKLTGTSFRRATLTNAKFIGATLKNCDLRGANLIQTDWTYACFMQCKVSGYLDNQLVRELCVSRIGNNQNFSFNDLSRMNLTGVSLCGADLTAANLNGTNLSQADLENADLSNVQAVRTDFTSANLTGVCIENWAITSETIFTNVFCSYIFLDMFKRERKPASGSFEQGDFAKLVTQSTKSLDFFFRNGIDSQAFDFALNNLKDEYGDMEISLKAVEDLGDGDRLVRLNTVPNAPKAAMHAQFTQDYEAIHQQLEASRHQVWELQQKLDRIDLENKLERAELEKQLAVAMAKLEERPTSQYLQNLVYHQANQLGQQRLLYAPNSTFSDTMTNKQNQAGGDVFVVGDNNQGVIGKDQQGVAGRDISGTVTNTIQQLRETNQPEAPQLSDLLEQLQKAVETSSELSEVEKQKALDYLNQIGEMSAKEPTQKKGMLPILLDAFQGVISKAATLLEPVKKIADAIRSIWLA
ncbi:Pentapeptide repeat-containing protein [Tumidithrix helvetica PCC 7403]|uniref:pentapeptide repeat-containing protein n=1 Tax=Tumidithrix helvetica TaxID=3457545 RepID=UPI003CB26040